MQDNEIKVENEEVHNLRMNGSNHAFLELLINIQNIIIHVYKENPKIWKLIESFFLDYSWTNPYYVWKILDFLNENSGQHFKN